MSFITPLIIPEYFQHYVDQVKKKEMLPALKNSGRKLEKVMAKFKTKESEQAYAPGKWTLKEMLQHLIDTERVFLYRALSFVRKDPSELPGFDENTWAANSDAAKRNWKELQEEFKTIRKSTILFYSSLTYVQLSSEGIASNERINVAAQALVCAGHTLHHIEIINTRYRPAIKKGKKGKSQKALLFNV